MTEKELFDDFLEVASHCALRAAAAAARSGAASPKLFVGLATIALWRLPCILGLALAQQQRPRRRSSSVRASGGGGGAGFPFQIFPTMPLVILSIQSSSWASTALIEKILDRARLVPVGVLHGG